MRRPIIPFFVSLGIVAMATAVAVVAVRRETARLAEDRQAEIVDQARARAEAARPQESATQQAAAGRREVEQLEREVEVLRLQVATPPVTRSSLAAAPRQDNPWENAGRTSPLATFKTVQWAIHAAEVELLEQALVFDPAAQQAAEAFFDSLDEQSRADFGTPRRLIASVMAAKSRSQLSTAEIVTETVAPSGVTEVRLRIGGTRMKPRDISMRFEASAEGWRLQVPAKIVTSYRNLLLGPVIDPKTYKVIR